MGAFSDTFGHELEMVFFIYKYQRVTADRFQKSAGLFGQLLDNFGYNTLA
jgi:hypothetical protein